MNKRRNMIEKDGIILPISEVQVTTWAEQNFLFAILKEIPTGYDWILNTHIQIRGSHFVHYEGGNVDTSITFYPYAMHNLTPNIYDQCPFIEKYTLPKELVRSKFETFHDFVMAAIRSGYYISTYMDQYFRNDIRTYGFHHPNFIYGFDKKMKKILLADNFENNKYAYKTITYSQADLAFELVGGNSWETSIFLYKIKEYRHEFYPKYVKEQLIDYLNPCRGLCYLDRTICMNPRYNGAAYRNEVYYGIECYDLIKKYIAGIKENDIDYVDGDWRSFSMLKDHKQLMLERYNFMTENNFANENNDLEEKFIKQIKDCEILINIFLKYKLTHDIDILDKILLRLDKSLENDKNNLTEFSKMILL